jgi:ribosome-associated heat shock protein Hsp15
MTAAIPPAAGITSLRIDKLLWFIRLAATRDLAREWAMAGHIRLNGRRIERASAAVRPGDVIVLPVRGTVRVIEIVAIPSRRGPAPEAQACYRQIDTQAPDTPTAHTLGHDRDDRPGLTAGA